MGNPNNLPVPYERGDAYRFGQMLSISNAHVPYEAEDIGDVPERANPRAADLGYVEGADCAVSHVDGDVVMHDRAEDRTITVEDEGIILRVNDWA